MNAYPAASATALVDRAVVLVLLTRLVSLLAAPVTLWLVATRRSLAEQGLYFVFWNVQALTQLMELGVGGLLVQVASHESPALTWNSRGGLTGAAAAIQRLGAALREGRRWYSRVGLVLLVLGGAGGTWLLYARSPGQETETVLPWLVTLGCTAAYLPIIPVLCVVEGCGGLVRVQRMRLVQVMASMAVLWMVLLRWGALWAVAAFSLVWMGSALVWLRSAHPELLEDARTDRAGGGSSLHGEPSAVLTRVQWRTAATWLALWTTPQLLSPIVLATHGAPDAGRVGMALAIAMAPLTLAASWLQGRYPRYGALVAQGRTDELRTVALAATVQAAAVWLAGSAAATGVIWLIALHAPSLATRVLPWTGVAVLSAANLAWLVVYSLGSYLRAWREEPLTESAIVSGVVVTVGTFTVALRASPLGTVAAHSLLVILAAVPLALLGLRKHNRRVLS